MPVAPPPQPRHHGAVSAAGRASAALGGRRQAPLALALLLLSAATMLTIVRNYASYTDSSTAPWAGVLPAAAGGAIASSGDGSSSGGGGSPPAVLPLGEPLEPGMLAVLPADRAACGSDGSSGGPDVPAASAPAAAAAAASQFSLFILDPNALLAEAAADGGLAAQPGLAALAANISAGLVPPPACNLSAFWVHDRPGRGMEGSPVPHWAYQHAAGYWIREASPSWLRLGRLAGAHRQAGARWPASQRPPAPPALRRAAALNARHPATQALRNSSRVRLAASADEAELVLVDLHCLHSWVLSHSVRPESLRWERVRARQAGLRHCAPRYGSAGHPPPALPPPPLPNPPCPQYDPALLLDLVLQRLAASPRFRLRQGADHLIVQTHPRERLAPGRGGAGKGWRGGRGAMRRAHALPRPPFHAPPQAKQAKQAG